MIIKHHLRCFDFSFSPSYLLSSKLLSFIKGMLITSRYRKFAFRQFLINIGDCFLPYWNIYIIQSIEVSLQETQDFLFKKVLSNLIYVVFLLQRFLVHTHRLHHRYLCANCLSFLGESKF